MASTYTNDLRLELIATGEAAATWGDKTNVNLTNIAAAFGYATQDGFAANADSTTTVADGVADPARAMYFKVTSSATLTATRTLTIAPNTISRLMWIENATTGGQSIAISQGTGANVTIPTGKTAVVYLDGAGSGAAVVDAMAGVSSGASDTLAEILAAGNTTGGTDIVMSAGDNITNASGDLTLDIAGDIILDAGGSEIRLSKAGTEFGKFATDIGTPSQFAISSSVLDGDIKLQGNDGGSTITALTLDMSAAGAATFNAGATFGSGIDVTGTVTADGLTVDGTTGISVNGSYAVADLMETDITDKNTRLITSGGEFRIDTLSDDKSSSTKRFEIDHATGDISFYEDTGTTPKFFWDASAEALGIGTASPTAPLHVSGSTSTVPIKIDNTGTGGNTWRIWSTNDAASDGGGKLGFYNEDTATRAMTLDSSGKVGIGTTSPTAPLTILSTGWEHLNLVSSDADATNKTGYLTVGHYTNAQESFGIISGQSTTSSNVLNIGGGAAGLNAATSINLYTAANNTTTTGTPRVSIDASGNVGIGTASPTDQLEINGGAAYPHIRLRSSVNTSRYMRIGMTDSTTSTIEANGTSTVINFLTAGSERMRIDSSGSVGIGTTTNESGYKLDVRGWGHFEHPSGDCVVAIRAGNNTGSSFLYFGDQAAINVGYIGYNHTSNSMSFKANTGVAMTIDSSQNLLVGKTSANTSTAGVEAREDGLLVATRSGSQPLLLDRLTNDGILALFRKDSTTVGDISVSSGVVSYNAFMGSHYSETVDTDLLFGTVMEVTGELVDQNFTAQERLSKVKVSDTSESKNVYGAWIGGYEGGGETVAALGASWCRIASGVTLELGDLLVSNGDGTAKVQSDDIIRSMTIGKVTSTTIKETYADGSYVVPVVLYCG